LETIWFVGAERSTVSIERPAGSIVVGEALVGNSLRASARKFPFDHVMYGHNKNHDPEESR